jgi:protein-S-isoprenylcysteine O-methyltransferase Ste14
LSLGPLAVFLGASALITGDLAKRDPELLRRRMRGGPTAEKEPTQRVIMLLASAGFISLLVVPGLTFTFATIEAAAGQKVIATGPYAIVRHPMYASALLYLAGTPLALGSYTGFIPFAGMLPVLIWRLLDEERLLATDLPGYRDYQARVRYRLIPYLW